MKTRAWRKAEKQYIRCVENQGDAENKLILRLIT
jgi:hypothetical protein